MNKVILIGNLASDPEFRATPNGTSYVSFRIACQRRYANQQGVREADFINCCAWRQTAEFIHRYFIKGNKIALDGSIQTRTYDAQDGTRRYVTEVLVENAEFVAAKSESQSGGRTPTQSQQGYSPAGHNSRSAPSHQEQMQMNTNGFSEADDDDELPF